ncbi:MAG: hypothetical protein AABX66_03220 [Nanoarchaeota archaeon]
METRNNYDLARDYGASLCPSNVVSPNSFKLASSRELLNKSRNSLGRDQYKARVREILPVHPKR